ncbi:SDR family NAD(P)-dependent oxidoreductase [Candidatus Bathyarchaeota archaeon]|nr:SDR family NAD(P)-dependent oxidoreductase [Candidatus Bathyarchaeota archaeon]
MRATTALASRLVTTLRTTTAALASKPQPAQSLSLPLQGRHCLIAGGSGALGSSIAADMARAGARVTLLGRNKYKLHTALSQLQPVEGVEHKYLVMKTPTNKEFMNAIAVCSSPYSVSL